MSRIYQATIINFDRNKMAKGGIEVKLRIEVEGYKDVHFFTPIVYPNNENIWIDWDTMNCHGEPKIKKKAGEVLNIQGEMVDYGGWVLEGTVTN